MTSRNVIALIGISGVGKSTILAAASKSLAFTHLQASGLIKEEMRYRQASGLTQDELRERPIADNQELLVAAFRRVAPASGLIVLDGHILIDSPTGITQIEPEVFHRLEVRHFVCLKVPPDKIFNRRAHDRWRTRPLRSVMELDEHQERSISATRIAATQIGVPVTILETDTVSHLVVLLRDKAET